MKEPVGVGPDLVIDVSSSGLVAATPFDSAVLAPTVAPASVLAEVFGTSLPPGGDRMMCSPHVDRLAVDESGPFLRDPLDLIDEERALVAGMSVPVDEVIGAPIGRALAWAVATPEDRIVILVPSTWGARRLERLLVAGRRWHERLHPVRAALITADALLSSTQAWTTVVETMSRSAAVSLVRRSRDEVNIVDRRLVHRLDPVRDRLIDDYAGRIVDAAVGMRGSRRETRNGSHELLACGVDADRLVTACDLRGELAYIVPPEATAEAAIHLGATMAD